MTEMLDRLARSVGLKITEEDAAPDDAERVIVLGPVN